MNWKRKLELVCGLITVALAIFVMLIGFRIERAAAEMLQERGQMAKGFAAWFVFYGLPGLLLMSGTYVHVVRNRSWGRLLVITATVFLTIWFFISLVLVVWSGLFLPAALLTVFAIVTSVVSLFVRSET